MKTCGLDLLCSPISFLFPTKLKNIALLMSLVTVSQKDAVKKPTDVAWPCEHCAARIT